jgi:hypothetical protein
VPDAPAIAADANAIVAVSALPALGPNDAVRCPIDDLEFRPYFTDGACPICGWRSVGVTIAKPWTHRADWALIAFIALVIASVAMAAVVLTAA